MLASLILAASAALTFTPEDAHRAYGAAADFVRDCTPRNAGTVRGHLAASWILDRVSRLGVDGIVDKFSAPTPSGEGKFVNVYVEFPGTDTNAQWVVFVSHFDTAPNVAPPFAGANDGASTTGLLIAMADSIRRGGRLPDSVALAWTDAEEARLAYSERDGFQGAKRLLERFRSRGRRIKAVVGLDMLGDRDLHVTIPANGYPSLRKIALFAAKRAGVADKVSLGADSVQDDFSVFHDAGEAAIDLIDFEFGPGNTWWHTGEDTIDKVSEESLAVSGKLAVELLNLLERR